MGLIDGRFVPFPTQDQLEESELDLIVSGTKDAVLMIEGFAREMPEDQMAEALAEAHRVIREIVALQEELVAKVGVQKPAYVPRPTTACTTSSRSKYYEAFKTAKQTEGKQNRAAAVEALEEKVKAELIPDPAAEGAIQAVGIRQRLAQAGRAHRSRSDSFRQAGRRARQQNAAQHRMPDRRAAAGARLGRVSARRNAGAGHRGAGHQPR